MSDGERLHSCVVIGAGISGLLAARKLEAAGVDPIVLEKSRGAGGRMATRRIEPATVDHGAQFFTVRDERFEAMVQEWLDNGVARKWADGFPTAGQQYKADGHPRYCGDDGMTSIAKYLMIPVDVRLGARVESIIEGEGDWLIRTDRGEEFEAEAIVATAPAPQTLAMLEAGGVELPQDIMRQLRNIQYDPCIAVLAVFDEMTKIPEPGGIRFEEGPVYWLADNHAKGISPDGYGVTIHTTPQFSRENWEADDDRITEAALSAVEKYLPGKPKTIQIHRWRYGQPLTAHPKRFLLTDNPAPIAFAGDAFGGSKIEGAVLSGLAAAEALLTRTA